MANTPSWSFWPDPNDPNPADESQAREFDPVFDPTPAQDMDVFNPRPGRTFGEDPASGTWGPEPGFSAPPAFEQAENKITWIDPNVPKPQDWSPPRIDLSFAQAYLPGGESFSTPPQAPASDPQAEIDVTGFGFRPPSLPWLSQPAPSDTARTIQWEGGPFAPPPDGTGLTVGQWPSAPRETAPDPVPDPQNGPTTWRLAHALFAAMPDVLKSRLQTDPLAPDPQAAAPRAGPAGLASSDPFGLLAANWNTGSFAPRFAAPQWPSSNPGMQPASPANPVAGDPATRTPSSPTWTTRPQTPMPQMPPAGYAPAGAGGAIPGFYPAAHESGGVQANPGGPAAVDGRSSAFDPGGPAAASYGGVPSYPATQGPAVPVVVRDAFHVDGTSLFGQPQWVNLLTRIGGRFKNTAVRPALEGQAASGPYAAFWDGALRHVQDLRVAPSAAAAAVANYTLDNAHIAPPGLLSTAQYLHNATQAWFQNRHGIPAGMIPRPQLESLTKSALHLAMQGTGTTAPFAGAGRPGIYAMIKSGYEANDPERGPQTPGPWSGRQEYLAQNTKPVPKPTPKPKPAAKPAGSSSSNKYLPAAGSSAYVDGQIVPNKLTTYSPQRKPTRTEGGYPSSFEGPDGESVVRTLEDYRLGRSKYVTIAGDIKYIYNRYTILKATYKIGNTVHTVENVPVIVHDKGGAFRGAPEGRYDVPIDRDLNQKDRDQGLENITLIKGWPKK